jgi:hypothetical protein
MADERSRNRGPRDGDDDRWDDRDDERFDDRGDRDDDRRFRKGGGSWIDQQFLNTNMVLLVLFALCCNWCFFLPLIFGILGLTTSQDPTVRDRAKIVTIIAAIMTVLTILGNIARFSLDAGKGFR